MTRVTGRRAASVVFEVEDWPDAKVTSASHNIPNVQRRMAPPFEIRLPSKNAPVAGFCVRARKSLLDIDTRAEESGAVRCGIWRGRWLERRGYRCRLRLSE